jgi:ABC-type antimicrobial peptide transport system permease subunit
MEPRAGTVAITLTEQAERSLGDSIGIARLAGALGLLALLLATVGVYGVVSYSVEQRRREIGIRMALGARPGEIAVLVLRRNSRGVIFGLVVGLGIAIALSTVLESELHGLSPFDPIAYGGVVALLLGAATVASLVPARRAARMDPVTALHHD